MDRQTYSKACEAHLADSEHSSSDAGENRPHKRGENAHVITWGVITFWAANTLIVSFLIYYYSMGSGDMSAIWRRNEERWSQIQMSIKQLPAWKVGVVSSIIGMEHFRELSAIVLVCVAFCSILIATGLSTIEVNKQPHLLPPDFEEKGTLSNVSQDVTEPNGRMFAVGLFTFGLLLMTSMYTSWLYRSWAPWIAIDEHGVKIHEQFSRIAETPVFQCAAEKRYRIFWGIVPNVLFMFTAAFPSLSDNTGYKKHLATMHNICAPVAMAVVVIMETMQLNFGENAFSYFFSAEPTPVYGPLTWVQRARVVTCCNACLSFVVFLGIQVYLGLGSVLGLKIKICYSLALISYYGEVVGMVLVGLLPVLAGMGQLLESDGTPSVLELASWTIEL